MKYLKFLILLLISTFYVNVEGVRDISTSTWDFTGVCGTGENGQVPCQFLDKNNWVNYVVPDQFSNIVIGPNTNGNKAVTIVGSLIEMNFTSITITGTQNAPINIELDNTAIVFNGDFVATQYVSIKFNNTATNGKDNHFGYDIDINGNLTLTKSSKINGYFTYFECNGALIDGTSSFSFATQSNVKIDGVASFYTQPTFSDNSIFIASDTEDGGSTFYNGINSDYSVVLGVTTLFGSSNFENLQLNAVTHLGAKSNVYISDTIKNVGGGAFSVNNATLSIGGFYNATLPPVTLVNGGMIVVNNPYSSFGPNTLLGNGTILFDTLPQGNNGAINTVSNIFNENIIIGVAGPANLFINNCSVASLFDQNSNVNTKSYTPMVSLSGSNTFDFISTMTTAFNFVDGSFTTLLGPQTTIVQGLLNLYGSLNIGTKFMGNIFTMDTLSYIQLNDSFIFGDVSLAGGRLHPSGSSGISKDLIVSHNGFLDFDEFSGNLDVNGNYEMDYTASIYIGQTLVPSTTAFMTVDGDVVLNGTLLLDVTNTQPSDGDSYRLIQCKGTVVGQFTTISPLINGNLIGLDYSVSNDNGIISITFNVSKSPHKKLPGWGVFLIILAILVVLGAGAYGFIRYKKRAGYLPLN